MHYDLIVIGGGPAGNEVASYAIHKGWKVAIIEERAFGGTCLNVGCIPSKGYLHRAKLVSELKRHRISYEEDNKYFSLEDLQTFSERTINRMASGIEQRLVAKGIEAIKEKVTHFSKNNLETSTGKQIGFDKLVIACGTKPAFPGILKDIKEYPNVYTNENIFQLKEFPKSMTIIGGGAIGVEMAYFFSSFGVAVDLLEALPSILAYYDEDIVIEAKKMLKKKRVNILEGVQAVSVSEELSVDLSNGNTLKNECILVATGRKLELPETDIGFGKDLRGFLKVNDSFQTTIENIYAIGDANGISLFAHSATDQGKQLGRLFLKGTPVDHERVIPSVVYTSPSIASVGLREKDAKGCVVKKLPYDQLGRAHIEKETEGFMKIIFKDEVIVGAHIIGAYAEEIISLMCLAVQEKMTVASLKRLIIAHPTYGELFIEAF